MTPEQRAEFRRLAKNPNGALAVLLDALDAAEARAERAEADADQLAVALAEWHYEGCPVTTWDTGCNCDHDALKAHGEAVKQRP